MLFKNNFRFLHLAFGILCFLYVASELMAADLWEGVKARGVLRIAVEGSYPPFNFKDPKTAALTGFEIDLGRALAKELDVRAEFIATEWSAILAGLQTGKFDIILNQVAITPERQKIFDFSAPYTISRPQLIIRKQETATISSLADLRGKKLGVGQGSVYEKMAKAVPGVEVKSYPGASEYLADLSFGRIDAALNDSLMVSFLLKNAHMPVRAGAAIEGVTEVGIPFVKGNPQFAQALQQALARLFENGQFAEISQKWFGRDVRYPHAGV